MANTWHIPSNSGDYTLQFTFLKRVSDSPSQSVWSASLTRIDSDRTEDTPEYGTVRRQVEEHAIHLGQLAIDTATLVRLLDHLRQWQSDSLPFSLKLTTSPGQELTLNIGPRPDIISSFSKPALTVDYRGCAMDFRAYTVLDQTCFRIAAEELEVVLRTVVLDKVMTEQVKRSSKAARAAKGRSGKPKAASKRR